MRRIPRLGPAVALVALAAVGAGCEYFRDTPEQELANQRWGDGVPRGSRTGWADASRGHTLGGGREMSAPLDIAVRSS